MKQEFCIWWPMIRTERVSFTWPWKLSMFWTSMIPVPSTPMLNEEPVSGCSKWFWPVANTSKSIDYIYFCCRYFILRTFFGISQFCKIRRFIFLPGSRWAKSFHLWGIRASTTRNRIKYCVWFSIGPKKIGWNCNDLRKYIIFMKKQK